MPHAPTSPMALLRSMIRTVDAGIEDAIDAHGFSLSALNADESGAVLHFATTDYPATPWHLTLTLPPDGGARLALRQGDVEAPTVALALAVAEGGCRDLPAALGIAMELFIAVGQP